jgi:transcriptional regulator with XRE-family HTH domain
MVKDARTQAGLSMRALAALCDVSQPFLSQVERGQTTPSLATLYRMAGALNVSVSSLLPEAVSSTNILHLDADGGRKIPVSTEADSALGRLLTIGAGHALEVVEYRVSPEDSLGSWFTSDGEQTLFVIEGQVRVELAGEGIYTLDAGGSLTHPASTPHRWFAGPEGCRLLLAVAHAAS